MKAKMEIKKKLFKNLDFTDIKNEADACAEIIEPILKELGFDNKHIGRQKRLTDPYLKIGRTRRKLTLIPDYVLFVGDSAAWVLDAKAPIHKVTDEDNISQVYSYAMHSEIRSTFFALCNGLEFVCYRTNDTKIPVLYFRIDEIDEYWERLQKLLSPQSFQMGKTPIYVPPDVIRSKENFDYLNRPLLKEIPIRRQATRRHFGVHVYFTRQSWNVVAEYIKNFSQKGDIVLDPFGGSGVTAVEAVINGRKAISLDINPLAVFIMDSLLASVKENDLKDAYLDVLKEYIRLEPKTRSEIKEALKKYPHPKSLRLPNGSDVDTTDKLFDDMQTARLGLLKYLILKVKNKNVRKSLMLMFSGLVHYYNRTSFDGPHGNTGSSAMWMYRYRLAAKPTTSDFSTLIKRRFKAIYAAKKEIETICSAYQKPVKDVMNDATILRGSATEMSFIDNESVDYIYTDPPYGKNIQYLDLSAMWYAWLDLDVSEEDYKLEAIVGGEHNKTKDDYNTLIAKSIQEMYRVLKFDRWLSFVFAHKDPEFWHLIIETCERCGFEYVGAVPQKNGSSNYHKRQHPFTVLSGQLIINFRKVRNPRAILKANLGMDIEEVVLQTIEGIIAKFNGASLEQINDELIIRGLELGFLDLLKKHYSDLKPLLDGFDYDTATETYNLRKNTKFQSSRIDLRLRINYYLQSFLTRLERENKTATFNEIIMEIMPLLKNGVTPEHQTILSVLKDIGEEVGTDSWRLKKDDQLTLFD
jgi:16S rRNA G966 N2-methylase RsmD